MSDDKLNLLWKPPGPVAQRFMAATTRVQIINGPIGSGKTTAALMKAVRLGQRQEPSTQDTTLNGQGRRCKVRKFRLCVVRDTYRQLWKTTLPSWWKRVPREMGDFVGSENAPASHKVKFALSDDTVVDFQADFVAIGENAVEDILRGYEPTAFYLNEADLLAKEVFTYAFGRAGRYPDMSEGGPTWSGVLMDCNAPELNNWLYREFFRASAEKLAGLGVSLFRQPSGLSPAAENTENLPPGYYADQVRVMEEWYIARMIRNVPGYSRAGRPCYPAFVDALHVPERELVYARGMGLWIGLDAGLNPAAVLAQRMSNGQWHILEELVSEAGTGPVRFGEDLARLLHDKYPDVGQIRGYADPSAAYGADTKAGEQTWIEVVAAKAGIRIAPAPTNRLIPRLEAVRLPLTRLIDGAPGLLLSPRCEVLREGFNAGYRFRKLNVQDERYAEEPEKNEYSHPHDALQYLLSAGGEDLAIRERRGQTQQALRNQPAPGWDPLELGVE